jgi:hypothetical protein
MAVYIHDEYFQALKGRGLLADIEKMAKARRDVLAVESTPTSNGWKVEVRTVNGAFRLVRANDKFHLAVEQSGRTVVGKEYAVKEDGLVEASIDFLSAFLRSTPKK